MLLKPLAMEDGTLFHALPPDCRKYRCLWTAHYAELAVTMPTALVTTARSWHARRTGWGARGDTRPRPRARRGSPCSNLFNLFLLLRLVCPHAGSTR